MVTGKVKNPYQGNKGLQKVGRGCLPGQGGANNAANGSNSTNLHSKTVKHVHIESSMKKWVPYIQYGASLVLREVAKAACSVGSTFLEERAFFRSDVPLPKGHHLPNFFQSKPEGFQFTGYWVGASAGSMLLKNTPDQVADAASAWWTKGTLPNYASALWAMPGFFLSLIVSFVSSAASAHFSVIKKYEDGSLRILKHVLTDERVGLMGIYWAANAVAVLANHAGELPSACKSIWNRRVSIGQATAKVTQCGFELMRRVFITKTYAEGILILPAKAGELGRYSYLVDCLTLANGVMSSFAAGCAKIAANWNDKKFKNYTFWKYVSHQIDNKFVIDQFTFLAGLMLTAAGSLQAASIFDGGLYDITDIGYACQFYLIAFAVGAYLNPFLKNLYSSYYTPTEHLKAA